MLGEQCSTVKRVRLYRPFERPPELLVGWVARPTKSRGGCSLLAVAQMTWLSMIHVLYYPYGVFVGFGWLLLFFKQTNLFMRSYRPEYSQLQIALYGQNIILSFPTVLTKLDLSKNLYTVVISARMTKSSAGHSSIQLSYSPLHRAVVNGFFTLRSAFETQQQCFAVEWGRSTLISNIALRSWSFWWKVVNYSPAWTRYYWFRLKGHFSFE